MREQPWPELYLALLKGVPVTALALYALRRHARGDYIFFAAVLAAAAVGDVTIEFDLTLGGAFFALSHAVGIAFFLRHRRADAAIADRALASAAILLVPPASGLLAGSVAIGVYGLFVGAMAAAAWLSDFPRTRVGLGALAFVASDLILFANIGPLAGSDVAAWTVWPLYYGGQFMIATGVVQTLLRRYQ